ncbi:hypothetical protein KPH14_011848 [Odynerus spinipes]|uniref:Uncharacterized protein n=1 Tax=Odynerus spinipes TaxID=1348599 RepID=A0AAD9RVR8_9HYME|nr:hypothetical protein KPH14_011848 [Odynerus spinipes]
MADDGKFYETNFLKVQHRLASSARKNLKFAGRPVLARRKHGERSKSEYLPLGQSGLDVTTSRLKSRFLAQLAATNCALHVLYLRSMKEKATFLSGKVEKKYPWTPFPLCKY